MPHIDIEGEGSYQTGWIRMGPYDTVQVDLVVDLHFQYLFIFYFGQSFIYIYISSHLNLMSSVPWYCRLNQEIIKKGIV